VDFKIDYQLKQVGYYLAQKIYDLKRAPSNKKVKARNTVQLHIFTNNLIMILPLLPGRRKWLVSEECPWMYPKCLVCKPRHFFFNQNWQMART